MEKRTPVTFYQETVLQESFENFKYPMELINFKMEGIIPKCESQNDLLKAMLESGSLGFNALVNILQTPDYDIIAQSLIKHNVKEFYRWIWLWSWDGLIMSRSQTLYEDLDFCKKAGVGMAPGWDSYDGAGSPYPIFCIESICKCMKHLAPGEVLPRTGCLCL
jgi:hypothetical protein